MKSKIESDLNFDIDFGIAPKEIQFYSSILISQNKDFDCCEIDICSFAESKEMSKERLKEQIQDVIVELQMSLNKFEET